MVLKVTRKLLKLFQFSKHWDYFLSSRQQNHRVSLLICTLRSDFEGGRKVVLKTQIFFMGLQPEKKIYYCRTTSLQSVKKNLSLQIHFFATLKITPKGADQKAERRFCEFWYLVQKAYPRKVRTAKRKLERLQFSTIEMPVVVNFKHIFVLFGL